MARGGKRSGSGRKPIGQRAAVLVRLDRDLEARIQALRNGISMSATVERLLRLSINDIKSDEQAVNEALGFVVAQAANAAGSSDRTWQDDPSVAQALKLALPLIIDLLAQPAAGPKDYEHPLFKSADEHARQIFFWIFNRLREQGNEYGSDWPAGHPLRNFPRAAATLNFAGTIKRESNNDE